MKKTTAFLLCLLLISVLIPVTHAEEAGESIAFLNLSSTLLPSEHQDLINECYGASDRADHIREGQAAFRYVSEGTHPTGALSVWDIVASANEDDAIYTIIGYESAEDMAYGKEALSSFGVRIHSGKISGEPFGPGLPSFCSPLTQIPTIYKNAPISVHDALLLRFTEGEMAIFFIAKEGVFVLHPDIPVLLSEYEMMTLKNNYRLYVQKADTDTPISFAAYAEARLDQIQNTAGFYHERVPQAPDSVEPFVLFLTIALTACFTAVLIGGITLTVIKIKRKYLIRAESP